MQTNQIVLLATGLAGLEVAQFLATSGKDRIARLYLSRKCAYAQTIIEKANVNPADVFYAADLQDPAHCAGLSQIEFDSLITVYWPNLLSQKVYGLARKNTLNFHPALLPLNRGWYPHVYSIIEGTPAGVTLHAIAEKADSGPIWAQRAVPVAATDTAKNLYQRLQSEIIALFKETWPGVRDGLIQPTLQDEARAIYRDKTAVDALDKLDPDKKYTLDEIVNLLRARSFGDRGFAHFEKEGKQISLNLRLNDDSKFD